jgi:FlaG/FlaF family flagellin (archaellin)
MVGREAGVSPVVGVMLLLVIVVLLAALVAAFAGGAVDVKERAPSVDLAVYTAGNVADENFRLIFEHRGGDLLRVDDLKVNTWVHLPGGDLKPASHGGKELEDLFGAEVWRAGEIGNTTDLAATADFLGIEEEEEEDKLPDYIKQSAVVDVAIYHLPSGALLHRSSFLLKER